MTRIWTAEELEEFEATIKAAHAGDVVKASNILDFAAVCLAREWPLPEPLRQYLVAAFFEITKSAERPRPPYPTPRSLAEMKENARSFAERYEEPRDANAALNLKRSRGRKRSNIGVQIESAYIGVAVTEEMEKGKNLEEAARTVADKMKISERTVTRAWQSWQQISR